MDYTVFSAEFSGCKSFYNEPQKLYIYKNRWPCCHSEFSKIKSKRSNALASRAVSPTTILGMPSNVIIKMAVLAVL